MASELNKHSVSVWDIAQRTVPCSRGSKSPQVGKRPFSCSLPYNVVNKNEKTT
jgi:hypothetical protein